MDPSPEQINALADQLSQLAKDVAAAPDPKTRKFQTADLVLQAKKMIWAIQDPVDHIMDQIAQLGVFDIIPLHGTATVKEISQKSGAEEELIIRLMRQLTCVSIFSEVSLQEYSHNRLSILLSEHITTGAKNTYLVAMDEMLPCILSLDKHIRKHGPNSLLHTYTNTLHSVYNNMPGKMFWEVLTSEPRRINTFMAGLSMWSSMHPVVAIFPFAEVLAPNNDPNRTLAVDIGGGRGLAMLELRKNCPGLQGQLVLQDQSYVLDEVAESDLPGVTKMTHDFFTPQPVRGAQMYYIRRVMHDWQNVDAARILSSIVPAMAPDSRIIVSDMALPEPVTERDAGAVWMDVMMMSIGGKERTKADWEKLGEMSGLRLVKLWMEPEKFGPLCVVEYMLPGKGDGAAAVTNEEATTSGEAGNAVPVPSATSSTNAMNLDGATDDGPQAERQEVNEDWEERTVVGDREQSVEPNHQG